MSQHCTLAVIGFDSEITKEIKDLVEKSYFDLRIEFIHVVREEKRPFDIRLQQDFDIIVLNPRGFSTPLELCVQDLKNQIPLAEIVMVSFEKDYHLILKAFRSGCRDILTYPLNEEEFLSSMERSQSYRSLYQKSRSLSDILVLLNQFGDIKKFRSTYDLMSKFDEFVVDKLMATPFLVISYRGVNAKGQRQEGFLGDEFRTLWNKKLYQSLFDKEELVEVLNSCRREELEQTKRPFIEVLRRDFYYFIIPLGEYDRSQYLGVFKLEKDLKTEYVSKISSHLARLVQNSYHQFLMAKEKEDLKVLVHHDDVTGLYNQRKLHSDLDKLIGRFHQHNEVFSIIFIDIDHFKSVNDGHGHLVGSQLLVEVADILRACLRDRDLIYRYGGDEFVVIIPAAPIEESTQVGERILIEIKNHQFRPGTKQDLSLSVSVGVAEFPRDAKDKEEVLQMADDMMYKAKNTGRGKVVSTREILDQVKRKA